MGHIHSVTDSDTHFIINPVTRQISNSTSGKISLLKGDHNSEMFTFELPRMVEGHDMSLCNRVEVHYINIDSKTRERNEDVYVISNHEGYFGLDPENPDKIIAKWLLSRNVTMYCGSLNFVLRFACISEEPDVDYDWHTAIFSGICVLDCINNSEAIIEEYSDVLLQWYESLIAAMDGSIDLNSGRAVRFWVGSQAEYNALTTTEEDCMYVITDDTTLQDLRTRVEQAESSVDDFGIRLDAAESDVTGLINGAVAAGNATNADHADTADNADHATNADNASNAANILAKTGAYKSLQAALLEMIYPIDSIKLTTNNINPETYLGGSWEAWGSGRVPVGVDTQQPEFDTVEKVGGEKEHVLSLIEMPLHNHAGDGIVTSYYSEGGEHTYPTGEDTKIIDYTVVDNDTTSSSLRPGTSTNYDITYKRGVKSEYGVYPQGGSQSHNNLQPYVTCYMWRRYA